MLNRPTYFIFGLIVLLAGCGEVAIKRGSSTTDLETTRKACITKSNVQKEVEKCLEEHGWFVYNPETQATEPEEEVVAAVPDIEQTAPATHEQPLENATAKTLPTKPQEVADSNDKTTKPQGESRPISQLDRIKVASWWKFGGNATLFESAKNICLAELGDAHKPDEKNRVVTRGFLACMKKQGWKTVQGLNYTKPNRQ